MQSTPHRPGTTSPAPVGSRPAPVAVVTGGNRGLGLETCRQLASRGMRVVLAARDGRAGQNAARGLRERGLAVESRRLDVNDAESIARFAEGWAQGGREVDLLVNNAGFLSDRFDAAVARHTLAVNCFGPIQLTDRLLPLLSERAAVVMVSSGVGALSVVSPRLRERLADPGLTRDALTALLIGFVDDVESGAYRAQGWPRSAYRVSKIGLNAFTRILARELAGGGIRVNAVCPGWVRTAMGGRGAPRGVEEGARSIIAAATLPPDGPSGVFFRDGRPIPW